MSTWYHIAAVVLFGGILFPEASLLAQPTEPTKPSWVPAGHRELRTGLAVSGDPEADKKLTEVEALLRKEAWAEAVGRLQEWLDRKEDGFVAREVVGTDGKPAVRWLSLRAEADRLVAALPEKGRAAYLTVAAPPAQRLLADAVVQGDLALLAETVRRYGRTPAGATARQLLANSHKREVAKLPQAPDWPVFRGDAARSGRGEGELPFPKAQWSESLLPQAEMRGAQETKVLVELAKSGMSSANVLPALHPVAVGDRLIFRTHWGVYSVDIRTGKRSWYSELNGSLDGLLGNLSYRTQITQWLSPYARLGAHLLFENSTIQTLSADGTWVYAVDDLTVPPHPLSLQPRGSLLAFGGRLADLVKSNRLRAYDVEYGKLRWEVGGEPGPRNQQGELLLKDCYFLGPPLPLGGNLYMIVESDDELRLVCLKSPEPDGFRPPSVQWMRKLAIVRDRLLADPSRRIQAAPLAFHDGILICPTNAGAVFGVDVAARSVAWVHRYGEDQPAEMAGHRNFGGRGVAPALRLPTAWRMAAPVIHDGKVVFTAPDGGGVQCLDLRDGRLLWEVPRDDDLYLAGVFQEKVVLVGKSACRALSLAEGKLLWQTATGTPAGMGVASGGVYYLPIKGTEKEKRDEVLALQLERGTITARVAFPENQEIGNIVFHQGRMISSTALAVTAFPVARVRRQLVEDALRKNPRDPEALYERAALHRRAGDWVAAVHDLRSAQETIREPLREDVRREFFETLTEFLRKDFAAAEKFLPEYEKLCRIEAATPAAEMEQRRRLGILLVVKVDGLQRQGKLAEALQTCLEVAKDAEHAELIVIADDPARKVRRSLWAAGQVKGLLEKMTPAQRKAADEAILRQWNQIKDGKELDPLRRFVEVFGDVPVLGPEARFQLIDRLLEGAALSEAELHLLHMRRQTGSPTHAARAVETLARLALQRGQPADAVYFYRELGRAYPKVIVRDQKTGEDFLNDAATDKRLLPFLK